MKRFKRGDINPTTGNIFWSYSHSNNGHEGWLTPEAYKRKIEKDKIRQKSPESKVYFKNYYQNNKQFYKEKKKGKRQLEAIESPLKLLLSNTRQRAIKRKHVFKLTYQNIKDLWKNQNGKCFYTKLPMTCSYANKNPFQVSIDRRNSNEGYTIENTVLCCLSINYCKNNFNEQQLNEFLEAFKLI